MEIRSLSELAQEATRFAGTLAPRAEGATLVTLAGDLGAGKTAFVQAIAKALGVAEPVTSPTFVLEKVYLLPSESAFSHLVHIDAYRLEGGAQLAPLGFDELMKDASNLILLEWPKNVGLDTSARPTARISLQLHRDGSRTITYA